MKRGRDTRALSLHAPVPRTNHMRIYREGGHLQARKRALTRNQPCWHWDLGLSGSKRNKFLLLSHSVYGILLWPPGLIKIECHQVKQGRLQAHRASGTRLRPGHFADGSAKPEEGLDLLSCRKTILGVGGGYLGGAVS